MEKNCKILIKNRLRLLSNQGWTIHEFLKNCESVKYEFIQFGTHRITGLTLYILSNCLAIITFTRSRWLEFYALSTLREIL